MSVLLSEDDVQLLLEVEKVVRGCATCLKILDRDDPTSTVAALEVARLLRSEALHIGTIVGRSGKGT